MICARCHCDREVDKFRRGRICRECERKDQEARRPARYAKNAEIQRRKKAERLRAIDKLKSAPCADCERLFPPYVMDFDHRDPSEKNAEINHLINRSAAPWSVILTEIAKCDVVCVRCHRLRTWKPGTKWIDRRRELIIALKSRPCMDCGDRFHFCQMDFDHVRGERIGPVPHMRSRQAILDEAAKCDVVCANCHRERTQRRQPNPRLDPLVINLEWELPRAGSLQTSFAVIKRRLEKPAERPWHAFVGTMSDKNLAAVFGVSRASVSIYRKKTGAPRFRKSLSDLEVGLSKKGIISHGR